MDELEDNRIETFRGDKTINNNPFTTTSFGGKEQQASDILKMAVLWQKWRGFFSHRASTHGKQPYLTKT